MSDILEEVSWKKSKNAGYLCCQGIIDLHSELILNHNTLPQCVCVGGGGEYKKISELKRGVSLAENLGSILLNRKMVAHQVSDSDDKDYEWLGIPQVECIHPTFSTSGL